MGERRLDQPEHDDDSGTDLPCTVHRVSLDIHRAEIQFT